MIRRIRVLIVDDSVVVRRMLTEILSEDPAIEVVGVAANGAIAMAKIPQLCVDVVTLDVEMPDKSGLEVLAEIRKLHPGLDVVMFSALTEAAAKTTLDALALGATDYVAKPQGMASREAATEYVRAQLLPKIRTIGKAAVLAQGHLPDVPATIPPSVRRYVPAVVPPESSGRIEILAVGASTGGPNALATFFSQIPETFPVPIVIVQHMPPVFTKLFAHRLSASCPLQFHEAQGGETLQPGHAYLAPGDYHMRLYRDGVGTRTALEQGPPENSCRPAVDVLFRSVVAHYGGSTLGVILTGMGQDGLRGCQEIRKAGGQVVVQDEATSVVWGMPGYVSRAGLAHCTLPLNDLAPEVCRRVEMSRNQWAGANKEKRHVG